MAEITNFNAQRTETEHQRKMFMKIREKRNYK